MRVVNLESFENQATTINSESLLQNPGNCVSGSYYSRLCFSVQREDVTRKMHSWHENGETRSICERGQKCDCRSFSHTLHWEISPLTIRAKRFWSEWLPSKYVVVETLRYTGCLLNHGTNIIKPAAVHLRPVFRGDISWE